MAIDWADRGARQKAQADAIRAATDNASGMLGGKQAESIANSGYLKAAAAMSGPAGDRARAILDQQQAKIGGGAAAYDKARQGVRDVRAMDVTEFDPAATDISGTEDKYGGGRTSEQYLADMMEGRGILDPDGYTEDRRDKQGVDEFMDLFQGPDQQGRDTPPQSAFDSGAVPPGYDTDPSAGYGPGGYDNPYYNPGGGGEAPPPQTPTGFGGGPGAPADVVPDVPLPEWGTGSNNREASQNQLQNLMAQRSRYYNNTDPNLGGPALGQEAGGDLSTPLLDYEGGHPGYTSPATGDVIDPTQAPGAGGTGQTGDVSNNPYYRTALNGGGLMSGGTPQHGGGLRAGGSGVNKF